ncbi:MAG TPA: hypothetical protein VIH37_07985, partial [Candidatus Limnocylindrales bacterium]
GTGAIVDAKAANLTVENIFANQLRLNATGRIGALAADAGGLNALETEVATLTAYAAAGSVSLRDDTDVTVDTVTVTVNRVAADGTTAASTDAKQADLIAASGALVLTALNGSLTINDGADAGAGGLANVGVSATGHILLSAVGANHDLTLNAQVQTSAGSVTLLAARNVTQNAGGNVAVLGGTGTIAVTATAGSIAMDAAAASWTNGANLRYTAAIDVLLGTLDARTNADRTGGVLTHQNAWGNIAVTATGGVIHDAKGRTASGINAYANQLRLRAATAVGSLGSGVDNALETEVVTLAAATTAGSGGLNLFDATAVTVGTVAEVPANVAQTDGTLGTAVTDAAS